MHLQTSVAQAARRVRAQLNDDQWLRFSKLCQMQRYELNKLVDEQTSLNPITYIRVAAGLESVGMKTRLSDLDVSTRTVMIALGLTRLGDFKDFFEKHQDHSDITKYVCEGARISEQTRERINALAKKVKDKVRITSKEKIDLSDVDYIRLRLGTATEKKAIAAIAAPPSEIVSSFKPSPAKEEQFKGLVLALLELSQDYLDPMVSESARNALREAVGQDRIFELKNKLSRLCSSKAFGR